MSNVVCLRLENVFLEEVSRSYVEINFKLIERIDMGPFRTIFAKYIRPWKHHPFCKAKDRCRFSIPEEWFAFLAEYLWLLWMMSWLLSDTLSIIDEVSNQVILKQWIHWWTFWWPFSAKLVRMSAEINRISVESAKLEINFCNRRAGDEETWVPT